MTADTFEKASHNKETSTILTNIKSELDNFFGGTDVKNFIKASGQENEIPEGEKETQTLISSDED